MPFVSAICNELRKRGIVERAAAGAADAARPRRVRAATATPTARRGLPDVRAARDRPPGGARAGRAADWRRSRRRRRAARRDRPGALHRRDEAPPRARHGRGRRARRQARAPARGRRPHRRSRSSCSHGSTGSARRIRGLVVVDVDARVLASSRARAAPARRSRRARPARPARAAPQAPRGRAGTVFTDPPYTSRGAALFLSRAAEATAGRDGGDVFLSFGPRRPEETLDVQRGDRRHGLRRAAARSGTSTSTSAPARSAGRATSTTSRRRPSSGRARRALRRAALHRRPPRPGAATTAARAAAVRRVGRGGRGRRSRRSSAQPCPRCGGGAFVPLPGERRDLADGPVDSPACSRCPGRAGRRAGVGRHARDDPPRCEARDRLVGGDARRRRARRAPRTATAPGREQRARRARRPALP